MTIDIVTPTFPESIQEGSIATWHKQAGETVARDDVLVDVETDKVVIEVVAPSDGVLTEIILAEGAVIYAGDVLGRLEAGAGAVSAAPEVNSEASGAEGSVAGDTGSNNTSNNGTQELIASPAARKIAEELVLTWLR